MFKFLRKSASQISPVVLRSIAQGALKASFDLTWHVSALASDKDLIVLDQLYGESLAFVTCLIQMRAQGKYRFEDAQELAVFVQGFLAAYKDYYETGLEPKIEWE